MKTDRLVVVTVNLDLARHTERDFVAARFRELGLTAYGRTEADAILAVKKLFNKFIRSYRESGQLERRLEQAGVEWYWADEHTAARSSYEDTNLLPGPWIPLSGDDRNGANRHLVAA